MKQYDGMFPGFSSQAKLLTSSPAAFKAAIKMAILQMKMLKGTTTTAGGGGGGGGGGTSSALFRKENESTTDNLVQQIKFNGDSASDLTAAAGKHEDHENDGDEAS